MVVDESMLQPGPLVNTKPAGTFCEPGWPGVAPCPGERTGGPFCGALGGIRCAHASSSVPWASQFFSRAVEAHARDVLARHPSRSCLRAASSNGRTSAAKAFDRLVADIESDLGGSDRLSAIERALLEGFAGCRAAVTLQHLNTQLALGQPIDLSQHAGGERRVARGVEARFAAKGARRAARQPSRQLLTCRELDGRTSATKAFDRLGFRLATRRQLGGIGGEFSSIPVTP